MSIIYKNLLKCIKLHINSSDSLQGNLRVLDYGCSTGSLLSLLDKFIKSHRISLNPKLYGLDIDEKLLGCAQIKVPTAELLLSKTNSLPFSSNSLDIIIATQVLEHIDDPCFAFKEFSRVLQNNGLLYFSCPNAASIGSWYKRDRWHSHPCVFQSVKWKNIVCVGNCRPLNWTRWPARMYRPLLLLFVA